MPQARKEARRAACKLDGQGPRARGEALLHVGRSLPSMVLWEELGTIKPRQGEKVNSNMTLHAEPAVRAAADASTDEPGEQAARAVGVRRTYKRPAAAATTYKRPSRR